MPSKMQIPVFSLHTDTSPYMNLRWMLGSACKGKVLSKQYTHTLTIYKYRKICHRDVLPWFVFWRFPLFLQQKRLWVSSWMLHSSLQITSRNPSAASLSFFLAHSSLFVLLASLMSWQYELPRNVHPRAGRHLKIVARDREWPRLFKWAWSCTAVVSSSALIRSSTIRLTSGVILDSRPLPGRRAMVPVSRYHLRNFAIPRLLQADMPSSWSSLAIVGALNPCKL